MSRLSTISLAIVVAYTVVRGLFLIGIVPPFQGPDEPGHIEYVAVLERDRRWPPLADDAYEARVLASMARHRFFELLSLPRPSPDPEVFADVERLGTAPTQLESESPVGYLPHALAQLAVADDSIESSVRWMRLASLSLAVLAVVAAAWAGRQALGPVRGTAVAALAAATPMLAFGGAVVNNDLTAAALCALWFGLLARSLRRGPTRRQVVALLALAALAILAKRTALFLLPTLLFLLVMPGFGLRDVLAPTRRAKSEDDSVGPGRSDAESELAQSGSEPHPGSDGQSRLQLTDRRSPIGVRGAAMLAVVTAAAVAATLWPVAGAPAHWERSGRYWGDSRVETSARSGSYGLRVIDRHPAEWQYLQQTLPVSGGDTVNASAWVRSDSPATAVHLVVSDDRGTWLADSALAARDWRRLTVGGVLADDANLVRLAVVPGDGDADDTGALDVDDVALVVDGSERLANGGAESPRRLGGLLLSGVAGYTDLSRVVGAAGSGLFDPVTSAGRTARAAAFLFRSYWGGFGWLTVWPPAPLYLLAAVLTAMSVAGLAAALIWPKRLAQDVAEARVLRAFAVAAACAVVVTMLGSVAGRGVEGIPQGRYLLTALVPLLVPAVALADRYSPRRGLLALTGLALVLDVLLAVWVIWPAFRIRL